MVNLSTENNQLAEQTRSATNLNPLPATGYVRISQLIGDPKANPPIPPIFPVGKSSIWAWVKAGWFPAPVKLGPRTTAWRAEDIRSLIEGGK